MSKKKVVALAIRHHFQVTPEEYDVIIKMFIADCHSDDPVIRQAARKELFDRLDGKPVQVVEDEDGNAYVPPVVNITFRDGR